ncbi:uncharacterized protein MYCFIDRAFT_172691 [Pseudocercospora fijiensis CIRAD86]|uniref:Uncharacterized protein n=1 Tax=Pseudocercospora fijiensis (strain CIRAD86) TaxID=383855 RepID=M3BCX0_PSEFD|nr:uncharacterized protein MYCFIDRAFT_172691 [Pseudocercospora fijiensis CIRAD86]EME87018.1 hypothetical protein MYCFIDRAFT_172691 [Pseudocercospora fijiensis CIRAD86]
MNYGMDVTPYVFHLYLSAETGAAKDDGLTIAGNEFVVLDFEDASWGQIFFLKTVGDRYTIEMYCIDEKKLVWFGLALHIIYYLVGLRGIQPKVIPASIWGSGSYSLRYARRFGRLLLSRLGPSSIF